MQIKDLLISVKKETELLKKNYTISGSIKSSNVDNFINLLNNYIDNQIISKASKIKINNSVPYTLHSINDIQSLLKDTSLSESKIELTILKNDDNNLIIFSIEEFKKTIKENLTKETTIIDTLNTLFLKNAIIIQRESFEALNYIIEDETLSEYLNEVSKSIKFNSPSKLKVSPYNIDIEKIREHSNNPIVNNFLVLINALKNFLSLLYILSSIDIKDKKFKILFDGTRERYFNLSSDEIINLFSTFDKYKELFFWIYKKESTKKNFNFIEKLDITRNLIATTISSEKGLIEINDNIYDILKKSKSNYKIYLKSKTKDYFELRFKIEEHTDKLFNSLGEEFSKFADFFRNNLYIFIGLLFSSVVFTILRAQLRNSDTSSISIFSEPNFSISVSIYGILSLLILVITFFKTISNISDLDNKLNSIKKRYINFIDKKDLINIIGNNYSKRKKKNIFIIIFIVIIWTIISIGLIFNKKILSKIEEKDKIEQSISINAKPTKDINTKNKFNKINCHNRKNSFPKNEMTIKKQIDKIY
ncbi:hypothetical protein [Aliarcobacter butzleri]|uniref:Uncharacterized protein n=1 Tax=Aliarcobacter butzleri TaxID=28197 RepID=A0AAW7PT08_9BACT|nr:hypothetical protein [Aliarcobacter butzleri]MDN5064549.1 hypothetical protein [Aliarcobacter butzleri]MDN5065999.1 hypothetical protein [Aliarcobacter butzleri]